MCVSSHCDSELPTWLHSGLSVAWKLRNTVGQCFGFVAVAAVVGAIYWFHFRPTDLERATSDLKRAWVVIDSFEDEAELQSRKADAHADCSRQFQTKLEKNKDASDKCWLEWCKSAAQSHKQLIQARFERYNSLLDLAGQYRRLAAEAECEILRAKSARDRGTPYPVAPRIQAILAPILTTN